MKRIILISLLALCQQFFYAGNPINLSLWKGVSTQRPDSTGFTSFNLGILSSMNRLNGIGVNVLGGIVNKDMNGMQLAGFANMVGNRMRGVQLAGITNINGNDLAGLSASGLVGITGSHANGAIVSGMATITGSHTKGIVASGLLNFTGEESVGVHIAGMGEISGGNMTGVSLSGLLNVVGGNLAGVQLAGLGNIIAGDLKGVQLSPINYATQGKGLQIGLVNYYRNGFDGFQLGLVNANPQTRVQLMFFGGNHTKLNLGVRFKNELFYTILGVGAPYLDFNDKFSSSFFYRAGLELPLCKRLSVSGDLGYQHIELFKNKHCGLPARLYSLQGRINLEYRLTNALGIFASGGYGWDRHYNRNANFDKGLIVEGGGVLNFEF